MKPLWPAMLYFVILALLGVLSPAWCSSSGTPCLKREYNKGIACVCNATYCDTIKDINYMEASKLYTYISTQSGQRMDLSAHPFAQKTKPGSFRITVDKSKVYQNIVGFGGAMTDAAGINMASLSSGTRSNLLKSYYSPQGIEYNLIRVPVAGTDYSTRPYTYCDGAEDITLQCFKLSNEDVVNKIPYLKEAQKLSKRPVKLFAGSWYAPQWMITTDFLGKGGIPPRYYKAWADYHKRFLEEYSKHGITFWGITTGNEPTFAPGGFVSWSSLKDVQTFINHHLGPTLQKSPFRNISLLLSDDQTPYLIQWQGLLRNPTTSKYVAGMATHWYMDTEAVITVAQDGYQQEFPNKILLSTEAAICEFEEFYDLETSWERGERYGNNVLEKLRHWGMGWVDWNLVLDMVGGPNYQKNYCDAPIRVNATADEFYKQPMFYVLGHFSKFLPAGTRRVDVSLSPRRPLKAVAFQTPGSPGRLVVVVLNRADHEYTADVCKGNSASCATIKVPKRSIITALYSV